MINKKIFIEFIGMPASGKSFYQDKIIRLIKKKTFYNKFNKLNKLQKIFFFLVFFIKYFRFTLKNLNFFFFTGINNKEFKKHFYYFKNEAALRIFKAAVYDSGFATAIKNLIKTIKNALKNTKPLFELFTGLN